MFRCTAAILGAQLKILGAQPKILGAPIQKKTKCLKKRINLGSVLHYGPTLDFVFHRY